MNVEAKSLPSPARWPIRLAWAVGGLVALLLAFVLVSEWAGWPFLAGPMQSGLSKVLHRQVSFHDGTPSTQAPAAAKNLQIAPDHKARGVKIHLFGGVDVSAARIVIAAPEWSDGPPVLDASVARLKLRYADLWRAWRGERMVVRMIGAQRMAVALERKVDGRASWQFGPRDKARRDTEPPLVEELLVADGRLKFNDAKFDSRINATYSLLDSSGRFEQMPGQGAAATTEPVPRGLRVVADGRYRALPFNLRASSSGVLFLAESDAGAKDAPVEIDAAIGYAKFRFDGKIRGLARLSEMAGSFSMSGRSLSSVGDVLGVTLPTTGPFSTEGVLAKSNEVWNVKVNAARIGDSRLNAALRYDRSAPTPMLEGRVGGPVLLLKDLGPVVGTTPAVDVTSPGRSQRTAAPGRVLPAREFDLPSLRVMNANVLFDFRKLDLGTKRLEPLEPIRAHLVLRDAVLTLKDIDARTSAGSLTGKLSLDGRKEVALWRADLRWQNILLEQWLKLARQPGSPPYISGRLDGHVDVAGKGRSTAQILASLDGRMTTRVRNGTVSHLLVEGAGIDLAQALGVWIRGDKSLPMSCALADMKVQNGLMRPEVFVIDTRDSLIWVDGSVSLIDESLDLRAVTSPKDFSLLSLRTPVLVKGTLDSPSVSLAPGPLAAKVIAAGLLSMLNPVAALIPLIDTGIADDKAEGCAELVAKSSELRRSASRAGS